MGVDPFDREYVWQRLWYAQRFFYTGRGLVDTIDNMLWDLASRHARLPLYKLLGGYRERIPAYRNIGGSTIDSLVADAVKAKEQGFFGLQGPLVPRRARQHRAGHRPAPRGGR